jgi:hypothetical protein
MVGVAVRDQDVGRALRRPLALALEGGVAGEEGIDQDHLPGEVEAER